MSDWSKPQVVSDVLMAFPAISEGDRLLPGLDEIPTEFKSRDNIWAEWQAEWFFKGFHKLPTPKPGIDSRTALRHLHCLQGTYGIKHEHKMAAVAYLASLWLVEP